MCVLRATSPLRFALIAWLCYGAMFVFPPSACRSDERRGAGNRHRLATSDVFLPAPRELIQQLNRAQQSLDAGRYSDAVSRLGQLLNDPESEDFFIRDAQQTGRMISLKAEAQRMLGNMSRDGQAAYELQFGAEARRLVDSAVNQGDINQLVNVSRKFFQTEAGQQATFLVGRYHLDGGRPLAAALTLQRLANHKQTAQAYEPELSLSLAVAWFYAGMEENGRQVLSDLQKRPELWRRSDIAAPAQLMTDVSTAAQWLLDQIQTRHGAGGRSENEWLLYRGNVSRNGATQGDIPLIVSDNPLVNCRWRVATCSHTRMEDEVAKVQQHYAANQIPALPSLQPLAVGGVILMRTPRYLFAVDASTGKRIWLYDDLSLQMGEGLSPENNVDTLKNRSEVLGGWHQRIWDDAPYGQMSSDGERVYLINKLGYPTNRRMLVGRNGINFPNPFGLKSYNELVALDLSSQGKRQWIIGGESGDGDSGLSGAFFLGAPLPIDGQLYVLAEVSGEIRLLILDAETGELIWRQPLIHTEESSGTIVSNALRRVAGASPSFSDGILVCPTTAGAVVAVDIATRSLLWGFEYEASTTRQRGHAWHLSRTHIGRGQPGNRWSDASVSISDGKVLITPVESDFVYCLRLFDGQLLWKKERGKNLFVGCVHDDHVVLVGRHEVSALHLKDGQPAWSGEYMIPGSAMPSGHGFLTDQHYYLPTTDRELLVIDTVTGNLITRRPTKQMLGNLICYDDCVISQSVDALTSFYQVEALRQRVSTNLASNDVNAWTLAHHAQLMLHDNHREDALRSLRKAYQLETEGASAEQPSDVTRALLVDTLLRGLRNDFEANEWLASEVEQLIDQPVQQIEYLQLMTVGLQQVGKYDKAFDHAVRLIDSNSDTVLESAVDDLQVRRDRWIQIQLANIHSAANRVQRADMDQQIRTRFQEASSTGDTEALRKFHQHFGFHKIDRQARLELATRLLQTNQRLEAETLLIELVENSTGPIAGTAAAQLARLYHSLGSFDSAQDMYRLLKEKWSEVPVWSGKTGRELWEETATEYQALGTRLSLQDWQRGRVKATGTVQRDARQFPVGLQNHPVTSFVTQGPGLRNVHLTLQTQQALLGKDRLGRQRFRIPLSGGQTRGNRRTLGYLTEAHSYGHLLLTSHGLRLLAIDTLPGPAAPTDRILWSQSLVPMATQHTAIKQVQQKVAANIWGQKTRKTTARTESSEIEIGQIGPLQPFGVCFQRGQTIVCMDPLHADSNPLWTRTNVPEGAELFGDQELLFVVPPDAAEAIVLQQTDGSSVGPRRVPPSESRWTTIGRQMLAWTESADRLTLTLHDPWYEEDVWSFQFPKGSKGCLVDSRQVAILSPDGRFVMINMIDGQIIIDESLVPEQDLESIHVLSFNEQYILATTSKATDQRGKPIRVAPAPNPSYVPLIRGRVYAFHRASGKIAWPVPAYIDRYGLPLDQPSDSPVVVFLRHETRTQNDSRQVKTTVLCLDRRDGTIALHNLDVARASDLFVGSQSGTYDLIVDPTNQQVTLKLFEKNLTMTFTDEPGPPEPPAQTGIASSFVTKRHTTIPERLFQATKRSIENLAVPAPEERDR